MKSFKNREGEYGKYILQDLILPAAHATPEAIREYERQGKKRIHWMDGDIMPGAFQINTSWYLAPNREVQLNLGDEANIYTKWQTHVHDTDELVCYYGSDPENPWELNGEIEMIIGDESHILTKSSMIFLPAGLVHSTPLINVVNRPIFHFSLVLSSGYSFTGEDGKIFEAKKPLE